MRAFGRRKVVGRPCHGSAVQCAYWYLRMTGCRSRKHYAFGSGGVPKPAKRKHVPGAQEVVVFLSPDYLDGTCVSCTSESLCATCSHELHLHDSWHSHTAQDANPYAQGDPQGSTPLALTMNLFVPGGGGRDHEPQRTPGCF